MAAYKVRRAEPGDCGAIAAVYNSDPDFLRAHLGTELVTEPFILAEQAQMRALGFCSCVIEDGESGEIQGVLDYPEFVTDQKGLWIKDTPGREPEILTGMAATGAQFMMFSTGRGAPQGFPCMPVVKICGNPITYPRMEQDMDLNAGLIITGDKTIEQVGEEAFAKALRTLSGEMTKNEAIQYVSSIDIHCLGPVI